MEDLKGYDAILSAPQSASGPSKGPVGGMAGSTGPLTTLLDHAMEEIFVPWLEGTRYLDSESKNLVELYGGLLSRFARYHVGSRETREIGMIADTARKASSRRNPILCWTRLSTSCPTRPAISQRRSPPPRRSANTLICSPCPLLPQQLRRHRPRRMSQTTVAAEVPA